MIGVIRACPARPVAPEDGTGVICLPCEMRSLFLWGEICGLKIRDFQLHADSLDIGADTKLGEATWRGIMENQSGLS